ncbi:YtxH domain-containing protein [Lapidilactobacillus luobeiensis]|uniref:YtxH domain-containing protein n=1 Tax=Lapidilactobacillus luobeiensis TaxID=2950371 RepID=UPI0021C39E03|nr:hypothetical protein [Lapidilactobacillus luobeiensis]
MTKQRRKATFGKGLLWGSVLGLTTVLLTSKKSGAQRRNEFSTYVDGLTSATDNVNRSVRKLRTALATLHHEISHNAVPTIDALKKDVTDFQFQAEPRLNALKDQTDQLQNDLNDLPGVEPTQAAEH